LVEGVRHFLDIREGGAPFRLGKELGLDLFVLDVDVGLVGGSGGGFLHCLVGCMFFMLFLFLDYMVMKPTSILCCRLVE
jgi:hypothetical protein